jgi:hypothetical protein
VASSSELPPTEAASGCLTGDGILSRNGFELLGDSLVLDLLAIPREREELEDDEELEDTGELRELEEIDESEEPKGSEELEELD